MAVALTLWHLVVAEMWLRETDAAMVLWLMDLEGWC